MLKVSVMAEENTPEEQHKKITCEICGREVAADEIWWQEDNDALFCRECRAEEESCGCSD